MYFYNLFCCLNFKNKSTDNKENKKETPNVKNIIKIKSFDSVSSSASTIDLQVRPSPKKL